MLLKFFSDKSSKQ